MANLKAAKLRELHGFLSTNDVFEIVNTFLNDNQLGHFEVDSIKFKNIAQTHAMAVRPPCPPGQSMHLECGKNGKCVKVCK